MKKSILLLSASIFMIASCVMPKKAHVAAITKKNAQITAIKDSMSNIVKQKSLELNAQKELANALASKNRRQETIIESKNNQITQIQNPSSKMNLENEIDKVSYSLGVNIANSLKSQGLETANSTAFAAAMDATLNGDKTEISLQESQMILQEYFGKIQEKQTAAARAEGENFLKENGKKEGVVTLPSGLQYEVITIGTGAKPAATDKVKTHYHGTLIDGTVFDSSVDRGEPISFPLNGVIKGWTEALQLMPVGSKWRLFIPSDLAYGAQGQGSIAPHSALIFEVELIDIEK